MKETSHFRHMLIERGIKPEWVRRTLREPDRTEDRGDGTRHFLKQIPEFGNRWLRVVVDVGQVPAKQITTFFDGRMRKAP